MLHINLLSGCFCIVSKLGLCRNQCLDIFSIPWLFIHILFLFSSEDKLIDFREREREGGRKGEKHRPVASPRLPERGPNLHSPHVL